MKISLAICCFAICCTNYCFSAMVGGGGGSGSSMGGGSMNSTSTAPLQRTIPGKTTPTKESLPPILAPPPLSAVQATYFHPGVLVMRNGGWQGSDHLFNLSKNIGISVSILQSASLSLAINEADVKKVIENVFRNNGINPQTMVASGAPSLPSFNLEILIYGLGDKGYAASCEGRLFESVKLDRIQFEEGMFFQAITWEKHTLIIGPNADFKERLLNGIKEIAETFAQRFVVYQRQT